MWETWRSRFSRSASTPPSGIADNAHSDGAGPIPSGKVVSKPTRRIGKQNLVNFKDLTIGEQSQDSDESDQVDVEVSDLSTSAGVIEKTPQLNRNKLIIIMVGLPGRGKTFLCNKIRCYLNWLGHSTRHFNVGSYRRLQKPEDEVQTADFFGKGNAHGNEARNKALYAALDDVLAFLATETGQVAIFDATNTTEERRQLLVKTFHGKYQYLFIESICNDQKVLEQNYALKLQYSPDYKGVNHTAALDDFRARVKNYEEVYEPINNRNLHFIKLIDMVTGRGHMDVNRISGYLPGKLVFFLMQICKAGMQQQRKIWLTRHGQSEFNVSQRIGGDSPLSASGAAYACCLPDMLIDRMPLSFDDYAAPVSVWTSTLQRTIHTAKYLPFPKLRWKALDELHAGVCDGKSYAEIRDTMPQEHKARQADKLKYRYPSGESYLDVIQRLEPVIIEMEREKESVVVVGHQAVLRAILGYFTAAPLSDIPEMEIPLHTLIELRPKPDGTMDLEWIAAPANFDQTCADNSGKASRDGSSHGGTAALAGFARLRNISTGQMELPVQVPFGATASGTPRFERATISVAPSGADSRRDWDRGESHDGSSSKGKAASEVFFLPFGKRRTTIA